MYLAYGSYAYPTGAASFNTTRQTEWSQTGRPVTQKYTVDVQVELKGTDGLSLADAQAEVKSLVQAFYNAHDIHGLNLIFYQDSGAESHIVLRSAGSLTGVRVVSIREPNSEGAEMATHRTIQVQFEATYPVLNVLDTFAVTFTETLRFGGGGAQYVVQPSVNGRPQRRLLYPLVPWTCTQSGNATGLLGYPLIPPPMFPGSQAKPADTQKIAPRQEGYQFRDWGVTWQYEFEDIIPLVGSPNVWRNP